MGGGLPSRTAAVVRIQIEKKIFGPVGDVLPVGKQICVREIALLPMRASDLAKMIKLLSANGIP